MWFSELVTKSAPKIIAVGKNYLKHAIEMGGTDVPK
jgi:2-keto-4-pentenoate hydratase/2-oxohepta-3-ene-1,7-dioic acid hydratase in catechol pathway